MRGITGFGNGEKPMDNDDQLRYDAKRKWELEKRERKAKEVPTFLVTMYCDNCRNYSDIRFPVGTIVKQQKVTCPICGAGILE